MCVDDGSPVDVVYLDFQNAFDKVPHQRLLIKLKVYGIGETMISWIQAWLTDRRQSVIVGGGDIKQESVLGPILFLIFINDLDDDLSSKVLTFADDTKVF